MTDWSLILGLVAIALIAVSVVISEGRPSQRRSGRAYALAFLCLALPLLLNGIVRPELLDIIRIVLFAGFVIFFVLSMRYWKIDKPWIARPGDRIMSPRGVIAVLGGVAVFSLAAAVFMNVIMPPLFGGYLVQAMFVGSAVFMTIAAIRVWQRNRPFARRD